MCFMKPSIFGRMYELSMMLDRQSFSSRLLSQSALFDVVILQVDFRLDFVEKLLEGSRPPNSDITPVLVAGLDLVNAALEKQPIVFVEHGWRQIYYLAGRVMQMQKEDLVDKLCQALSKVYLAARTSIQVRILFSSYAFLQAARIQCLGI